MTLSEDQVATILENQFPDLSPVRVSPIAEGSDHHTFEINGALIFRFPRTDRDAAKLGLEARLLPLIAPGLPIPVPVVRYVGEPGHLFQRPFLGHRKLRGVSGEKLRPQRGQRRRVARQLGQLLSVLHAFPAEQASTAGAPVRPLADPLQVLTWLASHREAILGLVPGDLRKAAASYLRFGDAPPPDGRERRVLCHHDLKGEHILISELDYAVTGIIDWSDLCLSHPMKDFQGLMIWLGEPFVREALDWYGRPVDDGFFERLRFYARCGALEQIGLLATAQSAAPLDLLQRQLRWSFTE